VNGLHFIKNYFVKIVVGKVKTCSKKTMFVEVACGGVRG